MKNYAHNTTGALVDLGAVTRETRGALVGFEDQQGGQRIARGLADD